jgi:phosphocarrier protein HPr
METRTVQVSIREGMHTRPAAIFVKEAARFKSDVMLTSGETTVNGKSIMGILMLALVPGASVTVQVEGPDESDALDALARVLSGETK